MIVNLFRVTCDAKDSHDDPCNAKEEMPKVGIPTGWHMVDNKFYCPRHEIRIDGDEL